MCRRSWKSSLTTALFTFGAAVFAVAAKFLPVFPPEGSQGDGAVVSVRWR
jgi:hypothetical protein